MKLAVPDMISPSYFPAIAAAELGFFREEGIDVEVELIFPVDKAYMALRDGAVDFVGGSAHSALAAFPQWQGVKLLCAQAQGMYWFLVMRSGSRRRARRYRGRERPQHRRRAVGRDGAAPPAHRSRHRSRPRQVKIAPVPGALAAGVNFGVTAAKALEDGKIDGFWANGMGAEVAVRRGIGTVVLDVRRGDGPKPCFNYTMASIAATDRLIARPAGCGRGGGARDREDPRSAQGGRRPRDRGRPQAVSARRGRADRRVDPPRPAVLRRPRSRPEFVAGMNAFARDLGLLKGEVPYEQVVATQFAALAAGRPT